MTSIALRIWLKLVDPLLRRLPFPRLSYAPALVEYVSGKRALEIGGPSDVFRDPRYVPVYRSLGSLDGCNFRSGTLWEGSLREGPHYRFVPGREAGRQYLLEATNLDRIASDEYEVLLSAHMLEHTANPVLALREWIRVVSVGGLLLLVLPHRDGTFDDRRPVTTLAHMIQDYERGVGEDDLTHLQEILDLHDLTRDLAAGDRETFRKRSLDNLNNRGLHHHVFDLRTAIELIDHMGLQILIAETAKPYHIIIAAMKSDTPDNHLFMAADALCLAHSCFSSDRPSASS